MTTFDALTKSVFFYHPHSCRLQQLMTIQEFLNGVLSWERNISRLWTGKKSKSFNSHHYILIHCLITSKKPLLHPILLKCRQIAPVISPFLNIFQVFYTGSGAVDPGENEDYDEEYVF